MSLKNHGPGGCCCGCPTLTDDFCDANFATGEVTWRADHWTNGSCYAHSMPTAESRLHPLETQSLHPTIPTFRFGVSTVDIDLSAYGVLTVWPGMGSIGTPGWIGVSFVQSTGQYCIAGYELTVNTGFIPPSIVALSEPVSHGLGDQFSLKVEQSSSDIPGQFWYNAARYYIKGIDEPDSAYVLIASVPRAAGGSTGFGNYVRPVGEPRIVGFSAVHDTVKYDGLISTMASGGEVRIDDFAWTASQDYGDTSCPDVEQDWLIGFGDPASIAFEMNAANANLDLQFSIPRASFRDFRPSNPTYINNGALFFSGEQAYHFILRYVQVWFHRGNVTVYLHCAYQAGVAIPPPTTGNIFLVAYRYAVGLGTNNVSPYAFDYDDCYQVAYGYSSNTIIDDAISNVLGDSISFSIAPNP